jgi:hypothetical protein
MFGGFSMKLRRKRYVLVPVGANENRQPLYYKRKRGRIKQLDKYAFNRLRAFNALKVRWWTSHPQSRVRKLDSLFGRFCSFADACVAIGANPYDHCVIPTAMEHLARERYPDLPPRVLEMG